MAGTGLSLGTVARRILHLLCAGLAPRRPRVLLYHGVDASRSPIAIARETFAAQMAWLARKGYASWPASVYVRALREGTPLPRRLVVITFDDGYRNNLDVALPEMERHGLVATCFVVTGDLGGPPRWEGRDAERIKALTDRVWAGRSVAERAEISASVHSTLAEPLGSLASWTAASSRGFELASHTKSHRFCDQEPAAVVEAEIVSARAELRAVGATGAELLAWPYGATNPTACAIARELGVQGAFAAEWEWERRDDADHLRLNRAPIDPSLGVFGIAWACGKGYEVWARLRAWRRRRTA